MNDFLSAPEPERMLLWIVLLPLFGAIINGFFGRGASKGIISTVAVGSVATSFLLALYCFTTLLVDASGEHGEGPTSLTYSVYEWFSVAVGDRDVPIRVRFVMDHLSGIMAVMVTGIASLIHIYSTEYMGEDPSFPRFMTYLNLFTASMLVLVLASNLPLMFVGWEGVGLCSYLLIGFWWENRSYAEAGKKAFIVNRIGDFGVLIGTFILVSFAQTFEFTEINAGVPGFGDSLLAIGGGTIGVTAATAAALFLFLGCTGKSAQLPLYVWLPDAMAGPTPVSALIHAATMVTAGVYLCCRLSPLFIASDVAMCTIAVTGALTALLGASIGVVQTQMKKILAYSTVSQLGFMFAAVGTGAFAAGFFHVFTHAFFKACLFLGAGSVMHAVHAHGDADIRYLGGMKKFMPRTRMTFLIACLAIAGFPLTSGFFSKDEILLGALDSVEHLGWVGYFVFGVLSLTAAITAFYMFRLYFLTFEGEFRGGHPPSEGGHDDHHDEHAHAEPHESGDAITVPLMVLALGALVVGFLGLPHWVPVIGEHSWWGAWLTGHDGHGAVASWGAEHHEGIGWKGPVAMSVGTVAGLLGIFLAYTWYYERSETQPAKEANVLRVGLLVTAPALLALLGYGAYTMSEAHYGGVAWALFILVATILAVMSVFVIIVAARPGLGVHEWAMNKWKVDELYGVFVGMFRGLAVVSANLNRIAVDGLLTWVPAQAARGLGWALTRLQTGAVYAYAASFTVGAAVLVWWFTYPHSILETEANGATVTLTADVGPGYSYRWDFDSDGQFDSEWTTEPTATHEYGNEKNFGFVVVVEGGERDGEGQPIELAVDSVEPIVIPLNQADREQTWARRDAEEDAGDPVPPTVQLVPGRAARGTRPAEPARVRLIAHDSLVRTAGRTAHADDDEFDLDPGETAQLGISSLRVAVRVRATVEVRNAFGNVSRVREDIVVRIPRTVFVPIALAERASITSGASR